MSRLLVAPKHDPQPLQNGAGGCYARWARHGSCPGKMTAEWLNNLGEDDAPYRSSTTYKNIDVRLNWLRGDDHIVALEPEVARLKEQAHRAEKELVDINQRLIAITGQGIHE